MASKLCNYAKLATRSSNYSKRMNRLSKQIFGELVRETTHRGQLASDRFTVKPLDLRDEVVTYYPRHLETGLLMKHLRDYGLFRDEHKDFVEAMAEAKKLKGKKLGDKYMRMKNLV